MRCGGSIWLARDPQSANRSFHVCFRPATGERKLPGSLFAQRAAEVVARRLPPFRLRPKRAAHEAHHDGHGGNHPYIPTRIRNQPITDRWHVNHGLSVARHRPSASRTSDRPGSGGGPQPGVAVRGLTAQSDGQQGDWPSDAKRRGEMTRLAISPPGATRPYTLRLISASTVLRLRSSQVQNLVAREGGQNARRPVPMPLRGDAAQLGLDLHSGLGAMHEGTRATQVTQ
jgi:hypothetical protein